MSADFKWTLWIMLYNSILKVVNVLEYCEDTRELDHLFCIRWLLGPLNQNKLPHFW